MNIAQDRDQAIRSHKLVAASIASSLQSEKLAIERLPAIQLEPASLEDYLDRLEYYYALACTLRLLELLQRQDFNVALIPEKDLSLIKAYFIDGQLLDINEPGLTLKELDARFDFIEFIRDELNNKMGQGA